MPQAAVFQTLVICEKPSVARDIAAFLGAKNKHKHYIEGNGYAVSWAFGHLLELKDLHDYKAEWKSWKIQNLPLIPEHFQLKPKKDPGAQEQLKQIQKLCDQAQELICATDAGREGELIFRYLLSYFKMHKKPFKRLWISSLTEDALKKGFAQLQDGTQFDPLYHAARCRSEADWIVGLNATRYYTVLHGSGNQLLSLGRVQTPVLSMIVHRDHEIANFKVSDYWELHTHFEEVLFKHKKGRFERRPEAQALADTLKEAPLKITDIQSKDEAVLPPYLYDLTELQKDMNKRFGMSADQTLKSAQNLYEKKHLTYPRTDSKFLTQDMASQIPELVEKLRAVRPDDVAGLDGQQLHLGPRLINDLKVTDHHAIIPTTVIAKGLSKDELYVYHAVAQRLLAALYPAGLKRSITAEAQILDQHFKATGTVSVELGWEKLYKKKDAKTAETQMQKLLPLHVGQEGKHDLELKTLKTKPPLPFTEATLLQMMETAGRQLDDKELSHALKERGLGTPATRASIIETLLSRQYIRRQAKNLLSTEQGQKLIGLLSDSKLKSPELTGEWELKLKKIEHKEYDADLFMNEVHSYIRDIVACPVNSPQTGLGACPLCQSQVIEGPKGYGCSAWKTGCAFVLWKDYHGASLSTLMATQLLRLGHATTPLMIHRDKQQLFVRLEMNPEGQLNHTVCEAPQIQKHPQKKSSKSQLKSLGPCPQCQNPLVESTKAYGCTRWREGCDFVVWKNIAKKKISAKILKELLATQQTDILSGFKSKQGKEFSARLKLVTKPDSKNRYEVKLVFGDGNSQKSHSDQASTDRSADHSTVAHQQGSE